MDGHSKLLRLVLGSWGSYLLSPRCLNAYSRSTAGQANILFKPFYMHAHPHPAPFQRTTLARSYQINSRHCVQDLGRMSSKNLSEHLHQLSNMKSKEGDLETVPIMATTRTKMPAIDPENFADLINTGPNSSLVMPTDEFSHNARNQDVPPLPVDDGLPPRLGSNVGRSVVVRGDLATAMTALRRITQANKVRGDSRTQKFHERTGMKRKRLKRERFRRRFKEGFKRMIDVVIQMKKQGL